MQEIYPVISPGRFKSKYRLAFCSDCGRVHWYRKIDLSRPHVITAHAGTEQLSALANENARQLSFI